MPAARSRCQPGRTEHVTELPRLFKPGDPEPHAMVSTGMTRPFPPSSVSLVGADKNRQMGDGPFIPLRHRASHTASR
jgi:hypothetical protein